MPLQTPRVDLPEILGGARFIDSTRNLTLTLLKGEFDPTGEFIVELTSPQPHHCIVAVIHSDSCELWECQPEHGHITTKGWQAAALFDHLDFSISTKIEIFVTDDPSSLASLAPQGGVLSIQMDEEVDICPSSI